MKILACGLLSAMLAGTAAALESANPLPPADTLHCHPSGRRPAGLGDSFHGAVGPTDQDPLPWRRPMSCWRIARYVDAGFITAAAIDEDGTLWGWAATRAGLSEESRTGCWRTWCPYHQSGRRNVLPCALTGRCGPGRPVRSVLEEHQDDPTIRLPRYWTR